MEICRIGANAVVRELSGTWIYKGYPIIGVVIDTNFNCAMLYHSMDTTFFAEITKEHSPEDWKTLFDQLAREDPHKTGIILGLMLSK